MPKYPVLFVLLICLYSCGKEETPDPRLSELIDEMKGEWVSEINNYSEVVNGEVKKLEIFYSKRLLNIQEKQLFATDTNYYLRVSNGDTIHNTWIKYGLSLDIEFSLDTIEFPMPGVCLGNFENYIRKGSLLFNINDVEWEYTEWSDGDTDCCLSTFEDLFLVGLGPNIISDQTGDTIILANCYEWPSKFVR